MKPEDLLRHPLPAQTPKLTLGCPLLDRFLGGGVSCESITEIVAESGTGKTQLSLQLLLAAQLPPSHGGLSAASLYLHSEFPFPSRRLRQLSFNRPHLPQNPLDRIFVEPLHSADHLLDVLPRLDFLVPKLKIKLVLDVLTHEAVCCFVTHCGWNSTLEALSLGVPMVGVPQWTDQATNSKFVTDVWGVGVRAPADGDGLVRREAIAGCIREVVEEGDRREEIRRNAVKWKGLAREAMDEGGSSDKNIQDFVSSLC